MAEPDAERRVHDAIFTLLFDDYLKLVGGAGLAADARAEHFASAIVQILRDAGLFAPERPTQGATQPESVRQSPPVDGRREVPDDEQARTPVPFPDELSPEEVPLLRVEVADGDRVALELRYFGGDGCTVRRLTDGGEDCTHCEEERFETLAAAIGATLALSDTLPGEEMLHFHFPDSLAELELVLVEAGLGRGHLRVNSEVLVFDGRFLFAREVDDADGFVAKEDAMRVVWSFHAGRSTGGPWVCEIYQTVAESNGVYFVLDYSEGEGTFKALGRLENDADAIDAGKLALSLSDGERAELEAADSDL